MLKVSWLVHRARAQLVTIPSKMKKNYCVILVGLLHIRQFGGNAPVTVINATFVEKPFVEIVVIGSLNGS